MINEQYSFGDFTGQSFVDRPTSEFNNSTIVGSCFYQEYHVDSSIFPPGMTGVTFERCILDNVLIPEGNTVLEDCTTRRIRVQTDGYDWIVDENMNPVERCCSCDNCPHNPADLPEKLLKTEIVDAVEYTRLYEPVVHEDSWYCEKPTILEQFEVNRSMDVSVEEWKTMLATETFSPFASQPEVSQRPNNQLRLNGTVLQYRIEGECYLHECCKPMQK